MEGVSGVGSGGAYPVSTGPLPEPTPERVAKMVSNRLAGLLRAERARNPYCSGKLIVSYTISDQGALEVTGIDTSKWNGDKEISAKAKKFLLGLKFGKPEENQKQGTATAVLT